MHDHFNQIMMMLIALVSSLFGLLFDVGPATLWVAAIGSALGAALNPPIQLRYGFLLIVQGTLAAGFIVPLFTLNLIKYPEKSIAFLLAVMLVGGRNLLPIVIQKVFQALVDRLIQLISAWGPKK